MPCQLAAAGWHPELPAQGFLQLPWRARPAVQIGVCQLCDTKHVLLRLAPMQSLAQHLCV